MVEPKAEEPAAEVGSGPRPAGNGLPSFLASHRRKLVVALALGAAVALVGAMTLIIQRRTEPAPVGGPAPVPGEFPTPFPLGNPSLPAAEDGGELRIVESGFSRTTDDIGDPLVTWGLLVENTSRVTAASVEVNLDIVDEGGDSLVYESDVDDISRQISVVMPGQRAGIGDVSYVTRPDAAGVIFELDDPQWWRVGIDDPVHPIATLIASQVEAFREGDGGEAGTDRSPLIVRFRVDSGYSHILDRPSAQAIFRDGDGNIVGGSYPHELDQWATFPPGWSIQWIRTEDGVPAQADLSRTQVYPYPSCC